MLNDFMILPLFEKEKAIDLDLNVLKPSEVPVDVSKYDPIEHYLRIHTWHKKSTRKFAQ